MVVYSSGREGRHHRQHPGQPHLKQVFFYLPTRCQNSFEQSQMDQVAKSEVGPPRCLIRAVVVLLGLLSVVLLAGLLGFAVKFKTDVRKNVK